MAEIKEGRFFGEIGMLVHMPRTATIQAVEPCLLMELRAADFHNFLKVCIHSITVFDHWRPRMTRIFSQLAPEALSNFRSKLTDYSISLKHLIHSTLALEYFIRHLRKEYSVENVYFWMDAKKFRLGELEGGTDPQAIRKAAQKLVDTYIKNGAEQQVNIDGGLQKDILRQWEEGRITLDMFAKVCVRRCKRCESNTLCAPGRAGSVGSYGQGQLRSIQEERSLSRVCLEHQPGESLPSLTLRALTRVARFTSDDSPHQPVHPALPAAVRPRHDGFTAQDAVHAAAIAPRCPSGGTWNTISKPEVRLWLCSLDPHSLSPRPRSFAPGLRVSDAGFKAVPLTRGISAPTASMSGRGPVPSLPLMPDWPIGDGDTPSGSSGTGPGTGSSLTTGGEHSSDESSPQTPSSSLVPALKGLPDRGSEPRRRVSTFKPSHPVQVRRRSAPGSNAATAASAAAAAENSNAQQEAADHADGTDDPPPAPVRARSVTSAISNRGSVTSSPQALPRPRSSANDQGLTQGLIQSAGQGAGQGLVASRLVTPPQPIPSVSPALPPSTAPSTPPQSRVMNSQSSVASMMATPPGARDLAHMVAKRPPPLVVPDDLSHDSLGVAPKDSAELVPVPVAERSNMDHSEQDPKTAVSDVPAHTLSTLIPR